VDTAGYALWALEMGGWKPDGTTAAVAEYLLLHDKDLDHWKTTSQRPPSEASLFTTNYLAVRALQTFGTTSKRNESICASGPFVAGWLRRRLGTRRIVSFGCGP